MSRRTKKRSERSRRRAAQRHQRVKERDKNEASRLDRIRARFERERDCGWCEACCWSLRVACDGTDKDAIDPPCICDEFESCEHQRSQRGSMYGCMMYDERPEACRLFECGWRQGFSVPGLDAKRLRPDRLGVILYRMVGTVWGDVMTAAEAFPGGLDKRLAKKVVNALAAKELVLVMRPDKRKLIGPQDKAKAALRIARQAANQGRRCDGRVG